MNRYDIVFIDIDGTLRNSDKELTEVTKEAIKKVIDKGIKVVLCTGRSRKYAKNVALLAGTSEYVVSSNGSEVTNINTDEVIYNGKIDDETIKGLLEYCQTNEINLLLNTVKEDYQTINESDNRIYIEKMEEIKDEVNQIVITSMNYDRMLVIPDMFKDKFPNIHLNSTAEDLTNGNRHPKTDYYHDYNIVGVSKAKGVVELLDYLNIPLERCITIGDSFNDVSMCEVAGYCVAMGNAVDKLKILADEVTKTNDENGVAEFLNTLVS